MKRGFCYRFLGFVKRFGVSGILEALSFLSVFGDYEAYFLSGFGFVKRDS